VHYLPVTENLNVGLHQRPGLVTCYDIQ